MKWILIFLVIINIAIGGLQIWKSTSVEPAMTDAALTSFDNLQVSTAQNARLEQAAERTPIEVDRPSYKCIRISGLSMENDIPVVSSRLKALEAQIIEEKVKIVLRRDYQVIVGPFASIEQARSEMQAIGAKGVESYVITSGLNKNALSLGVFSSEANAKRKVADLSDLLITATIATKEHVGDSLNLIIPKASASIISDSTLKSILTSFKNAKFSRYTCE